MALLLSVSFPAFATHDPELYGKTKSNIVGQLEGSWGFKRYTDRRMYTYSRISVRRFGYFHHLPNKILKPMIHHWKALIKSC